jgi:uncharacterized protein (DUF305 family)
MTVFRAFLAALTFAGMIALASSGTSAAATTFGSEMRIAMDKMMAAMDVRPSGRVDEDFVAMMVPHHQGAIDMSQAELQFGRNPLLQRIAQEIIIDQQQEIAAMHLALGQTLPASKPSPDRLRANVSFPTPSSPK